MTNNLEKNVVIYHNSSLMRSYIKSILYGLKGHLQAINDIKKRINELTWNPEHVTINYIYNYVWTIRELALLMNYTAYLIAIF